MGDFRVSQAPSLTAAGRCRGDRKEAGRRRRLLEGCGRPPAICRSEGSLGDPLALQKLMPSLCGLGRRWAASGLSGPQETCSDGHVTRASPGCRLATALLLLACCARATSGKSWDWTAREVPEGGAPRAGSVPGLVALGPAFILYVGA